MRVLFIILISTILYNNVILTQADDIHAGRKVRLLHVLFRHGDRTPISFFPTDPNKNHLWNEGLGELTTIGKQQHYALGGFLKDNYKDVITGDPVEVTARSSGKNRCLMSAACHLASLYAPPKEWVWNSSLDWRPIPIQTVPLEGDGLLNPSSNCPKADEEEEKVKNSPEGKKFMEDNKKLFTLLSNYSGLPITDWVTPSDIYDTLYIEQLYNLTLPSWTPSLWDQMAEVHNISFYLSYSTLALQRLRAGLFLKELKTNLNEAKKTLQQNKPLSTKLYLYSSHDTQVAAVLSALQVFDKIAPRYCATILFELLEDSQGYSVRVLYFNSKNPLKEPQIPQILTLPSCEEFCPLDKFLTLIEPYLVDDWRKECGLTHSEISKSAIIIISFLIAALVLAISLAILLVLRLRRNIGNNAYQPLVVN